MGALARKEQPDVFAEVGLHADVDITLAWDASGTMPMIHIGSQGRATLTFADVDSLQRLSTVAADGVRELQKHSAAGAA